LVRFSGQFYSSFFIFVAIFSFLVGGIGGLEKQNIKRLLAYGSIHFLGFLALGIATKTQDGFNGCFYSLIIYALNMLTFFSILLHIKRRIRAFRQFSDLDGLSKFSPFLSICLSIVVLSFAGFPFFPGFLGKFFILKAAIYKKLYFLTFLALSTSILSSIYYLKFLSHMFLKEFSLSINPLVTLERTKFLVAIGIGLSYVIYICPNIIPKIHLSDFYMK
jgi:NADH-quinone oxidoreductase subunit N